VRHGDVRWRGHQPGLLVSTGAKGAVGMRLPTVRLHDGSSVNSQVNDAVHVNFLLRLGSFMVTTTPMVE
jgi:hypothetical protein